MPTASTSDDLLGLRADLQEVEYDALAREVQALSLQAVRTVTADLQQFRTTQPARKPVEFDLWEVRLQVQ